MTARRDALTTKDLNRALLARQLLLERAALPVTRALDRIGGLQAQYAPSAYVGLWSRLDGFTRDTLTTALQRRRVVQGTLLRTTIHIVSSRDYPVLAAGIRRTRRQWWSRVSRHQAEGLDMDAAARCVRAALSSGPLRQPELLAILEENGFPRIAWSGVGLWVDLVRVPPSGTWERRRADLYALADDWVGSSPATEEEGLALLVRRYLGGFGPAPLSDVASWAGVPAGLLEPAAERMRLRHLRGDDGADLLDLPRATSPDGATPAPVRFLPTWDATLLVHARRTQILPEELRPLVFNTRTPHSVPTVLVDGAVVGTWRYERGRVAIDLFDTVPARVRRDIDAEAARLAAFHAP